MQIGSSSSGTLSLPQQLCQIASLRPESLYQARISSRNKYNTCLSCRFRKMSIVPTHFLVRNACNTHVVMSRRTSPFMVSFDVLIVEPVFELYLLPGYKRDFEVSKDSFGKNGRMGLIL